MTYLVLDRANKVHIINKGFACLDTEINKELARACGVKEIATYNYYTSHEGAKILYDHLQGLTGLDYHADIQAIFYRITPRKAHAMALLQEQIERLDP